MYTIVWHKVNTCGANSSSFQSSVDRSYPPSWVISLFYALARRNASSGLRTKNPRRAVHLKVNNSWIELHFSWIFSDMKDRCFISLIFWFWQFPIDFFSSKIRFGYLIGTRDWYSRVVPLFNWIQRRNFILSCNEKLTSILCEPIVFPIICNPLNRRTRITTYCYILWILTIVTNSYIRT